MYFAPAETSAMHPTAAVRAATPKMRSRRVEAVALRAAVFDIKCPKVGGDGTRRGMTRELLRGKRA